MNLLIAQIIGVIAVILFVTSIQYNEKSKILIQQAFANLFYAFQYLMLGAISASIMNIISMIRCLIFAKYDKENKKIPQSLLIAFILIIFVLGIINYTGPLSLIPVCLTILYIASTYPKNEQLIRLIFVTAAVIWMYYNFQVRAYICLIGNIFELISGIISMIRYKKKKS